MSVLDFPTSPTNGQYYNGFIWNAANETWDSSFAPRPATIPITSPNYLINGGFDIWQRGTSGFTSGFFADRWFLNGANSGSRSTDVPTGFTYSAAVSNASLSFCGVGQRIESLNSVSLVGKQVTVSFWAKRTGTTSGIITVQLFTPASTDNYSSQNLVQSIATATTGVSTSWTKYSVTFNALSIEAAKGICLYINHDNSGVSGNMGILIAGIQLEEGIVPTDFRRNASSIAGELNACQRYYWRWTALNFDEPAVGIGIQVGASNARIYIQNPVEMRATPFSVTQFALMHSDQVTFSGNLTGFSYLASRSTPKTIHLLIVSTASFPTRIPVALIGSTSTSNAHLEVNAEI
jgi:hypothetical protein